MEVDTTSCMLKFGMVVYRLCTDVCVADEQTRKYMLLVQNGSRLKQLDYRSKVIMIPTQYLLIKLMYVQVSERIRIKTCWFFTVHTFCKLNY